MKIYRLLLFALLLSACKTQQCTVPLVVRDSISITYKQGKEQPISINNTEEQPTPTGVRGAATLQIVLTIINHICLPINCRNASPESFNGNLNINQ